MSFCLAKHSCTLGVVTISMCGDLVSAASIGQGRRPTSATLPLIYPATHTHTHASSFSRKAEAVTSRDDIGREPPCISILLLLFTPSIPLFFSPSISPLLCMGFTLDCCRG